MPEIPAHGRLRQKDHDKPRLYETLSPKKRKEKKNQSSFLCLICYASCLPAYQVIPQLIARIDTPRPLVGRLIHQLLTDIGRYHPQVRANPGHFLVKPLMVGLVANLS